MRAFSNKKQTLSALPQMTLALPLFRTMLLPKKAFHFPFVTLIFLQLAAAATVSDTLLPSDAVGLLSFKSKADADNNLLYTLNERFDYCQWQGVKCVQGRVVRFVLQGFGLRGVFAPGTLSRLDQLRVLSLRNNSLTGPIPDLASLANLRSLLLDRNSFSGTFPLPLLSLHRLLILDLSHNNMTGPLPQNLTVLDRLNSLRLDVNLFNGSIPRLNQSFLLFFNVSNNNLTGPVPVTSTLKKFGVSSFASNPELCGEIINKLCVSSPFFEPPPRAGTGTGAVSPSSQFNQNRQSQQVVVAPPSPKKQTRVGVILGFLIGILFLIAAVLCVFALFKRYKNSKSATFTSEDVVIETNPTNNSSLTLQAVSGDLEAQDKHKQFRPSNKSGDLIFCAGEAPIYTLDQLMRASAELLGRGSIGITYKAVMVNHLIVSVKRLDACKTAITSGEVFERHMEAVGGLRHPNLVPVRAYFQAKQERLIIYDYQPNGSVCNLIHGSRSTRAKPLHWTSCLKIAEDVAQGLAYIHQASRLSHANLKSSNVLLGSDFEACLTDYCLATLADLNSADDPDYARYKAPEIHKSNRLATAKSDVYAYGVLLLELLTGKHPSQHPFLTPPDMPDWVRAMREDDAESDNWLRMLVEVAGICSLMSPEQRPTMRQVLRMINEIKERAMVEDNIRDSYGKYS